MLFNGRRKRTWSGASSSGMAYDEALDEQARRLESGRLADPNGRLSDCTIHLAWLLVASGMRRDQTGGEQ